MEGVKGTLEFITIDGIGALPDLHVNKTQWNEFYGLTGAKDWMDMAAGVINISRGISHEVFVAESVMCYGVLIKLSDAKG